MAFKIQQIPYSDFEIIQLEDNAYGTCIQISTRGGILNSWTVQKENQQKSFILGNDFAQGWNMFEKNGFRGGKMSPFSCRLYKGQYQHAQEHYQIQKFYLGEHAMHGILYDALFNVVHTTITSESATLLLEHHYQGTDQGFPFPYTMQIEWILLKNNTIQVKTSILNQHHSKIPIMDGWHPYFTLGGKVDDYVLTFKNKGKLVYDASLIPTGNWNEDNRYQEGLQIGATHFDDCYALDDELNTIQLSYQGNTLIVKPLANYPCLQIYTPDDRASIAIENLSGVPNCFNNKMGLHYLEPQNSLSFETSYQMIINVPQR